MCRSFCRTNFDSMNSMILLALTLFASTGSTIKVSSYFKFDEVEHFHTDYKKYEQEGESIYFKSAKNQQEEYLLNVLLSQKASFEDTVLMAKLEELGFTKSNLSSDKVDQLKKILKPNKSGIDEVTFCEPIYNDVLVFKSKNKIVGFAKICFGCEQMMIIGHNMIESTSSPTEKFSRLKDILKQ